MSPRTRRTAALAGGAAVLAFGAYTVGSQAGDGVAQSQGGPGGGAGFVAYGSAPGGGPPPGGPPPGAPGPPGPRGPRGAGLSDLAKKLGVKQADLQKALDKLRQTQQPPNPGDKRDELATKLADKLNVDKGDVQKALDEIGKEEEAEHAKRRDEFAAALAKELGISADKVKDALPPGPPHHGRRGP